MFSVFSMTDQPNDAGGQAGSNTTPATLPGGSKLSGILVMFCILLLDKCPAKPEHGQVHAHPNHLIA